MKKILIVSRYFAPENIIGAVRMTKVAKYLKKNGYEILVLTDSKIKNIDDVLQHDLSYFDNVIRVSNYNKIEKIRHKIKKKNEDKGIYYKTNPITCMEKSTIGNSAKNYIICKLRAYRDLLYKKYDIYSYTKAALDSISESMIDISTIQTVISTFTPMENHLIAYKLKMKFKNIKWIADFRDPAADPGHPKEIRKYMQRMESKIVKNADVIVGATKGYVHMIANHLDDSKKVCIYNGYDPDEMRFNGTSELVFDGVFKIVVMGGMYNGRRDVTPLFSAIAELINDKVIQIDKIKILYLGDAFQQIYGIAQNKGIDSVCSNIGNVTRSQALSIQSQAQLLISSAWNYDNYIGVVPGKLYEQIMLMKPILGIVLGEKPNSELKSIINAVKCGFCYEQAEHTTSFNEMKLFVQQAYIHYFANRSIEGFLNEEDGDYFQYDSIIKQWINIIEGIC